MSKQVVNLTMPVVVQEIENVLNTYPSHPYQQAFAIPDLRQNLIAHVLNQTSSFYTVVDDVQPLPSPPLPQPVLQQRSEIEALVRHGIHLILQENSEWVSHHIPSQVNSSQAASHWFG